MVPLVAPAKFTTLVAVTDVRLMELWSALIVAAPFTVTFPPEVYKIPVPPVPPVILRMPNVRVPPVVLLARLIPLIPPVTLVFPKLTLALDPATDIPDPLAPEIVVEPNETVPALATERLLNVMPVVALDVLVTLVNDDPDAKLPPVRLRAPPVPLRAISLVVSVPKPAENILKFVVLPMLNPRSVALIPAFKVMAFVPAVVVPSVGAAPVPGSWLVPDGVVKPVIASIVALAPWPINIWLFCGAIEPL